MRDENFMKSPMHNERRERDKCERRATSRGCKGARKLGNAFLFSEKLHFLRCKRLMYFELGYIYSIDECGVSDSLSAVCCGINARNQVEKTRLSSEKGHKNVSASVDDTHEFGSDEKSVEMKIFPIFCHPLYPHQSSAIFWTLRRTHSSTREIFFYATAKCDVALANVHT